jgi:glutaredoxin
VNEASMKSAVLYRMVTPEHVCPYGVAALDLLKRSGYEVEEHELTSRQQADAFKQEHGVDTTPQVFIEGKRIGGFDELRRLLGVRV